MAQKTIPVRSMAGPTRRRSGGRCLLPGLISRREDSLRAVLRPPRGEWHAHTQEHKHIHIVRNDYMVTHEIGIRWMVPKKIQDEK